MDLTTLSIKEAHEKLVNKEITVSDLVNAYTKNITEKNDELNVYLTVFDDLDDQIKTAQDKIDSGNSHLLTGIPLGIKDVIQIEGKRATGGSKILESYISTFSATVIQKLNEVSPVFLGKTNTDEFAQGGSTENSAYGVTKNPHDINRVAGGSSGGSAAAVGSKMALSALGSDTGGSIRLPASFCGVVGLKPTYGSVSRHGLMAMTSSLDVIGPMTKTVEDAKIIFETIKGKDEMDSTTVEGEVSKETKVIGIPRKLISEGVDPDVLSNFEASIEKLKSEGYEVKDVDIPDMEYSLAVYYVLVPAEISSNMSRYDGVRFGEKEDGKDLIDDYFKTRGKFLGEEVRRRIMMGTYVLSSGYTDQYYNKAWQVRNLITENIKKAFEDVDVIALPTSPVPAFKIGEKSDPLSMYLVDIFTVTANIAGIPAISIPDGTVDRDGNNLPTGFQLYAPHFGENRLFDIGEKFERIN
ncbi:MAG: aspartyl-tRNA(Asn)/glutamyl-tRNA(Gln) amidotransferase subunit A [Candidatus Paceibacteria bacterium]|jgi:aspartyl-tRNA(Asn)/glutamyl-tRNA(Gln) amidotransferase subunit A